MPCSWAPIWPCLTHLPYLDLSQHLHLSGFRLAQLNRWRHSCPQKVDRSSVHAATPGAQVIQLKGHWCGQSGPAPFSVPDIPQVAVSSSDLHPGPEAPAAPCPASWSNKILLVSWHLSSFWATNGWLRQKFRAPSTAVPDEWPDAHGLESNPWTVAALAQTCWGQPQRPQVKDKSPALQTPSWPCPRGPLQGPEASCWP